MTNVSSIESAAEYKIESVRVPAGRIASYAKGLTQGTDDIALVKTQKKMVFIPGKIMPVCLPYQKNPLFIRKLARACGVPAVLVRASSFGW